jgi:importin subunit beta-1
MLRDDEKVSIQAYEFWCSISDEEIIRLQHHREISGLSLRALSSLWEVMKHHYLNRNVSAERDDPDAWNNVKAASSLLENLAICTNDTLIDFIFQMIGEHINSESAKIRDSVMLAFGSILNCTSPKLQGILPGAFEKILSMLTDNDPDVRVTVAWCLKKISEHHSNVFKTNRALLGNLIEALLRNISDTNKVTAYICDTIHHLSCNLKTNDQNGILTPYYPDLLGALIQTAFQPGAYNTESNIALSCLFTVGSLVDYAAPDAYPIIDQIFTQIVMAFESTLKRTSSFTDETARLAYQSYLATIISACTVEGKVSLSKEHVTHLYNLLKETFIERNAVYEEGLMACSSLATCVGREFLEYISDFGGFLVWGLTHWQDVALCRIAINSTSDIIRSIGADLAVYMKEIIEKIIFILQVNIFNHRTMIPINI